MKDNEVKYEILVLSFNQSETVNAVSFISNNTLGITERSDIDKQ
jgi:hypothetical protein